MRSRKKPWTENEILTNPFIVKEPRDVKGGWRRYFERPENQIQLEIGCGKGRFISEMSRSKPNVNFIGIEFYSSILAVCAKKVEKDSKNCALIRGDAAYLEEYFDRGEVDRIYIHFCDPWPKARHAKRRLTHRNFLAIYQKILKNGGEIFFKTDSRPLFDFSIEEFTHCGFALEDITYDLHNAKELAYNAYPTTEYEEKFSAQGIGICSFHATVMKDNRPIEQNGSKI